VPEPQIEALHQALKWLQQIDARELMRRVECPVLLLFGRLDGLVPVTAAYAMHDQLPDSQLHVFERAAHAPFISHQQECVELINEFAGPNER
jgi:pimeloyl-[acyl-carrier protein] methyl ester esterase